MIVVENVTNKALILSDGTKIPVLVATLSDYAHEYTTHEMFLLNQQVARSANGLVSSCGYWVEGQSSEAQVELIRSLPNPGQSTTYGDNTGFEATISTSFPQDVNGACYLSIGYRGSEYSHAWVYTGYSHFEACLPVIFVDENNNLINCTGGFVGLDYRSEDILPLAMHASKYLVTQYNGETVLEIGYSSRTLYNTNHNMDKDLTDPNDPFDDDDDSEPGGGGDGDDQDNWDDDSDPVPVPDLPDLSAVDTGFITLFNPTVSQLQNLASYLWSGAFDVATFKKITADPMDVILGLSIVPVDVPSSTTAEVTVGNIGTGIYMLKANSQYVSVDCGSIAIHEKDHSYLDYAPYTKVTIILPFIGAQELSIDELNGESIGVIYHIDVLSGACIAFVTIDGNVIHQYAGQCAVSIPITAQDFTQTIMALGQLVVAGIGAGVGIAATGGMAAPISGAMVAGAISSVSASAINVANSKPNYSKTGSIAGSGGLLAVKKPYLIFEYPRKCKPANQQIYTGYPSMVTFTLGSLSGFTQVQDVHLDNISCTDKERDEILSLLREGVIL